ncbi:hypothetical protein NHX12_002008 [Muraenolepis orangiensis]|uniref:R-spondin Fu-CRD domain-containing protein n=1 Tax=Muraenolepis orangiensis TaxID=630683 RepID=A0A9Q0IFH5_9TELE|nr:hypothetical protein NHX12_002008 [Muraenolepis orangiensis]
MVQVMKLNVSKAYGQRSGAEQDAKLPRIENCESCFSKDFCTKCKSGFYLHKGHCFDKCPEGFAPMEDTMECGVGSGDSDAAHCEEAAQGHDTLSHHRRVQEVQNGRQALQKRDGQPGDGLTIGRSASTAMEQLVRRCCFGPVLLAFQTRDTADFLPVVPPHWVAGWFPHLYPPLALLPSSPPLLSPQPLPPELLADEVTCPCRQGDGLSCSSSPPGSRPPPLLGGSEKQRTKEPKKKNTKHRLRFQNQAQNQHSDHLASVRSTHRD